MSTCWITGTDLIPRLAPAAPVDVFGRAHGRADRAHVLTRHALPRFHAQWDRLLKEVLA